MKTKYPISNRDMCGLYTFRRISVGDKIWFREEKRGYTVRASNVAFVILTKPMNAKKTVLYTIIDWESGVRGTENLIFGMGAETDKECEEMLERLTNAESEISSRNHIDIDIVKYWNKQLNETYREQPERTEPIKRMYSTTSK